MLDKKIATIMGPTASGKSGLAIRLAKRIGGEIISGDAFQVYRGMDIGTAKIRSSECEGVPHHLIDVKDVSEHYSAAEFVSLATRCIDDISARNKVPIIVGGSGLYIQALLEGYQFPDEGSLWPSYKKWTTYYKEYGLDALVDYMNTLSPNYFERFSAPDPQRLIRSISVLEAGGSYQAVKMSDSPIYPGVVFALEWDREVLYDRINIRVQNMVHQGLQAEAVKILENPDATIQVKRTIGYNEWRDYFTGDRDEATTIELIQRNTRRFAKRQMTWLRRMDYIVYLRPDTFLDEAAMVDSMIEKLHGAWGE